MKILSTITLLFFSLSLFAQKSYSGGYRDYFGSRIELNADSTFKYSWRFDLSYSWTKGKWYLQGDTLFFHMIPTHDTISYKNDDGAFSDNLILSVDETPERMTPEQYAAMGLSSGGQNIQGYPDNLFYKKGRLYKIYKGKLVTKKQKGFWGTKKKWDPWYFKSDD